MSKLAQYQFVATCLLGLLAWVWNGPVSAISIVLGCLSYFLPTLLSVALQTASKHYPEWIPAAFFVGEVVKVFLALMFMLGVFILWPQLHWLAFFIGLLCVSHIVFLVFWKIQNYGK